MLNLKKYIPIGLVLIIIALVLVGYYFVFPGYEDHMIKKKELDIKDEEIVAKEEYLPRLEVVAGRLLEHVDQITIVETSLPFEPSIAALSNYFQKTVSQNGLILKNIDVSQLFTDATNNTDDGETESVENMSDMLFSATVTGSYPSFKTLLLDIYLNARIIGVDSFSFSSTRGDIDSGPNSELILNDLLDYNINLRTQSYGSRI